MVYLPLAQESGFWEALYWAGSGYFDDQFDLAKKIQFFDQNPEQAEK